MLELMYYCCNQNVTTFAVVWIEMLSVGCCILRGVVTTFAVVWIEITITFHLGLLLRVTTFAVVWIEILRLRRYDGRLECHHLRGGVD